MSPLSLLLLLVAPLVIAGWILFWTAFTHLRWIHFYRRSGEVAPQLDSAGWVRFYARTVGAAFVIIGWSLGTLVSLVGLALSYWLDLPSGPAVVAFYGVVLLIVALVLYVVRADGRKRALVHIALGVVALLLVVGYFQGLRKIIDAVPSWKSGDCAEKRVANPKRAKRSAVGRFDDLDIESKAAAVRKMKDLKRLKRFFAKATTPGGKLELAERVAQLDPRAGAELLLSVLASEAPPFFKDRALARLGKLCGRRFDVDFLEADAAAAAKVVAEARRCVRARFGAGAGNRHPDPAR